MAASFKLSGLLRLLPSWAENSVTDSTRVEVRTTLANGTGNGQANTYWRDVLTIGSQQEAFVDLQNLSLAFYGATGSVSLAKVKQLLIVNKTSTSTLYLLYGTANQWNGMASGESVIGPLGSWWASNPNDGYDVTSTSKVIPIGNDGETAATVEIYVVGVKS